MVFDDNTVSHADVLVETGSKRSKMVVRRRKTLTLTALTSLTLTARITKVAKERSLNIGTLSTLYYCRRAKLMLIMNELGISSYSQSLP